MGGGKKQGPLGYESQSKKGGEQIYDLLVDVEDIGGGGGAREIRGMCNFADSGTRKKAGRPSSLGEEEAGVARGRGPQIRNMRGRSWGRGRGGGVYDIHYEEGGRGDRGEFGHFVLF